MTSEEQPELLRVDFAAAARDAFVAAYFHRPIEATEEMEGKKLGHLKFVFSVATPQIAPAASVIAEHSLTIQPIGSDSVSEISRNRTSGDKKERTELDKYFQSWVIHTGRIVVSRSLAKIDDYLPYGTVEAEYSGLQSHTRHSLRASSVYKSPNTNALKSAKAIAESAKTYVEKGRINQLEYSGPHRLFGRFSFQMVPSLFLNGNEKSDFLRAYQVEMRNMAVSTEKRIVINQNRGLLTSEIAKWEEQLSLYRQAAKKAAEILSGRPRFSSED